MNKPMTRSCIRIEREKQIVFRTKRLIRARNVVCLRGSVTKRLLFLWSCYALLSEERWRERGIMDYELRIVVEKVASSSQEVMKRDTITSYALQCPTSIVELVVLGRNNPSLYTVNGQPLYVHLNGLAIVLLK